MSSSCRSSPFGLFAYITPLHVKYLMSIYREMGRRLDQSKKHDGRDGVERVANSQLRRWSRIPESTHLFVARTSTREETAASIN